MSEQKTYTYQIEQIEVSSLKDYDKNARVHSEDQVEQIAASIREFGFTAPVLIDSENGAFDTLRSGAGSYAREMFTGRTRTGKMMAGVKVTERRKQKRSVFGNS